MENKWILGGLLDVQETDKFTNGMTHVTGSEKVVEEDVMLKVGSRLGGKMQLKKRYLRVMVEVRCKWNKTFKTQT